MHQGNSSTQFIVCWGWWAPKEIGTMVVPSNDIDDRDQKTKGFSSLVKAEECANNVLQELEKDNSMQWLAYLCIEKWSVELVKKIK